MTKHEVSYQTEDGVTHFVVVYDSPNVRHALERVVCELLFDSDIQESDTGNHFVLKNGTRYCIREVETVSGVTAFNPPHEDLKHKTTHSPTLDLLKGLI